jgi:hypothetical protein
MWTNSFACPTFTAVTIKAKTLKMFRESQIFYNFVPNRAIVCVSVSLSGFRINVVECEKQNIRFAATGAFPSVSLKHFVTQTLSKLFAKTISRCLAGIGSRPILKSSIASLTRQLSKSGLLSTIAKSELDSLGASRSSLFSAVLTIRQSWQSWTIQAGAAKSIGNPFASKLLLSL